VFCIEQLLPIPSDLAPKNEMSNEVQAIKYIIFGCKLVDASVLLIEKYDSILKNYLFQQQIH